MTLLSLNLKATEIVPGRILYGFWGFLLLMGVSLHAQQTSQNLEKLARNPVGDTVKIPLAESINFDAGPYGRGSNSLQIQPTLPLPGVGPSVLAPTATDTNTGAGKWGLGPSLALVVQPNWGNL
jgi:hypothetical protein